MKRQIPHTFDYYALLFFAAAFLGWLWEVLLYLSTAHAFVNRGVCRGPYLPIYGAGGVLLMILLHRDRRHPLRVFWISCFLCTLLEYLAGKWLTAKWGSRWWDYSGQPLNLEGHVCLAGAAAFGFCGVLLICVLQPVFNKLYHRMTIGLRVTLCLICLLVFTADAAYSAMLPNTGLHINSIGITPPLLYNRTIQKKQRGWCKMQNMEIEKKYTVKRLPDSHESCPCKVIEQAYLNTAPVVRVRRSNDDYYLTYKGSGLMAREEYNLPLDEGSYRHLLKKADGNIISKKRYVIPLENPRFRDGCPPAASGLSIELDIFEPPFAPLVMAEVEFPSIELAEAFIPPEWFDEDVTDNIAYHNSAMSRKAFT